MQNWGAEKRQMFILQLSPLMNLAKKNIVGSVMDERYQTEPRT